MVLIKILLHAFLPRVPPDCPWSFLLIHKISHQRLRLIISGADKHKSWWNIAAAPIGSLRVKTQTSHENSSSMAPWAARLEGGTDQGSACLPLLLQPRCLPCRHPVAPADISHSISPFIENACLRQKGPLTFHVKWTVRLCQEAAGRFPPEAQLLPWQVWWLVWDDGNTHKSQWAPTLTPGSFRNAHAPWPFPEIPFHWLWRNIILCIIYYHPILQMRKVVAGKFL